MQWKALVGVLLCLAACSDRADPAAVDPAEVVTVVVALPPEWRDALVAPASGRVRDSAGTEVATFSFEASWDIPLDWAAGEAVPTGAPSSTAVVVASPGTYTFEIGEVAISGSPCGTCEQGYASSSIVAEISEGSVVELPVGDPTWIS